jgi:hypothetical protein
MRNSIAAAAVLLVVSLGFAGGQGPKPDTAAPTNAASKPMAFPAKVPPLTQFVLFNKDGSQTKLAAGQATPAKTKGGDCVLITCPETFDRNIRCWKCI